MADQSIPLKISIAPFPEGFSGDMDETFQQACILMEATVEGQFLTGLILPPGSTLPTTDQGPIAMNGIWYFYDPVSGQYLPQSISARPAKNYVKNGSCQVQQTGSAPALVAGVNKTYDMCLCRMTTAGVLTIASDVGPLAGADYDTCQAAIKYTVVATASTLGATDLYAHEHLIEGSDLAPIQNEVLSLSFLCWVNQAGTYSAYLSSGARDESYCVSFTMPTASTWTRVKIQNIPAIPTTGTWSYGEGTTGMYVGVTMASGTQWLTANTAKWNNAFFAGGTSQSNMAGVTNNQMKITAVRLEASPQCGYASVNSFETDLHDAIRYYYTSFSYQSTTAGVPLSASVPANGTWNMANLFPRRMAKVPTVTPYSWLTKAAGLLTDITGNYDIAVASVVSLQKGIIDSETATLATTGTTSTSINVTAIPTTAALHPGMPVTGSGVPAGCTIATIVSGTAITLSAATTSSLTGTALTFSLVAKNDLLWALITADARLS